MVSNCFHFTRNANRHPTGTKKLNGTNLMCYKIFGGTCYHLPQGVTNSGRFHQLWYSSSWNVMAHGDAREGKWRGNWGMEWVASTLHITSEHGVSSITTADGHISAASSRLNWRPCRFKWTRPFRRRTKSGFCACAIIFQTHSKNFLSG
jgi:hypothetical protein